MKEEWLGKLADEYETEKMRIRFAAWIAEKVAPMIPAGWEAGYIPQWHGLLFSRHTTYDTKATNYVVEYQFICRLLETAIGIEVAKEPWIEGDHLFCLMGKAEFPMTDKLGLRIEVRMFDTRECQLTYKTETVRRAELLNDCLGGNA